MTKFYGNIFAILTTINKKSHPEGWLNQIIYINPLIHL